jgi:hypothetical protein
MSELNWQKDSQIEIDALDLEWVRHSHKYMLYSEAAARANDIVRKKKNDLEIVDAKLDQLLRIESEGSGKKLTADAIKALIITNDDHIKALVDYNDALYQADLCNSAVKAMDHKKSSLQNLVQLWAGSYFAGPKQPRDLKKEIDIQQEGVKAAIDEVREKIGRRQRNTN